MLYTIPDYYKEFHCIADKCEDTCCAGWQIVIDEKSLAKYKQMLTGKKFSANNERKQGDFRGKMLRSVNWMNGTFRQDRERRCAFLNENNLCDLYTYQGEKSLCRTCKNYPRHIEEFEGLREITLSVSCPEVARILMERKAPVKFLSYEKEGEEEMEDFDPFLFSVLEDARSQMIQILQNREISMEQRAALVMGMAHDMQRRINSQKLFECFDVIEKYAGENALRFVEDYLEQDAVSDKKIYLGEKLFRRLYQLEFLKEDWYVVLKETEMLLFSKRENHFKKRWEEFINWSKSNYPDLEIHLEQLLVYFLFTYFPGAVYDGEVYSKVKMAVYCVWMIEILWMGRWFLNEKSLDKEEMTELVYRFSREVEHSDENLKRVETFMKKRW